MSDWWRQWLKVAAIMFVIAFALGTLIFGLFFGPWKAGLMVGTILGALASLGLSFYLVRDLKRETLEINSANKDPRKGLSWYHNEIAQYLHSQRYQEMKSSTSKRCFTPPIMGQHMGGVIELESDAYSITITGPRGFIRILASVLEIKKIFI